MADIKSTKYLLAPTMPCDGRAVVHNDRASIPANPTVNDTVSFPWPAGLELSKLWFKVTDMDSNGSPTLAGKIGYKAKDPASAIAASDSYFFAAAALGQAAALIDCNFLPVSFNEEMLIQITWTAVSATFVAGTADMTLLGNSNGPK